MRRKSPRFLAWLLVMSMLITTVPLSLAEEIPQTPSEPMEIVLQPVDISTEGSTQLNQDEVQKYQQIADELSQTNEQISIEDENGLVVYSLKEGDEASDGAIVQEFSYSSDENAALSLTSYAEITLASADGSEVLENQVALMDNAGAPDEQIEQYNVAELDSGEQSAASTDALSAPSEEQTEFEDEYKSTQQTVITAEELLANINAGDEFSFAFAKRLGLGVTKNEAIKNLQTIVTEYHEQVAMGVDFEEPRFIINGVDIVLNENIEELSLIKNDDGTYSVSMDEAGETGYRTSVMIDADASVTIIYDEKGEAKIERKVVSGKPTDFVITLDISGSMAWDGRDNAMFSALQVVLDEILAVKENTVSIVFWAENGAPMQINTSQNGVMQVFSGKDGMTAQMLFDANLVNTRGVETSTSLSSATISALESIYRTGSGTQPDKGLAVAYDLLNALETSGDRNVGVMLFTDGMANYVSSEKATVSYEKKIAEEFGATVVNVSIGDEYDVKNYERYLDPNSDRYYEKDNQVLQDHVLYYNIPKLSNQELADRVSEMFEIAFEEITTETKELQTETITDGVLAAYGARLISTIPAGFELVELQGNDSTISYQVNGVDSEGNTTISFNLEEIISQKDMVLSYCVIPTQADNDIGVTAYFDKSETVLYAEPVDRIQTENAYQEIKIVTTKLNQTTPDRAELPDTHQHVFTVETVLLQRYKEFDAQYHYICTLEIQMNCITCGAKGDIVTKDIPIDQHGLLEPHLMRNTHCIFCGYVGPDSGITIEEKRYYEYLMNYIHSGENPLNDLNSEFVQILRDRLHNGGLTDKQIDEVVNTLRNAPAKYRDLYLMGLFNYNLSVNKSAKNSGYTWPSDEDLSKRNSITLATTYSDNFTTTFFHESGHATEINIFRLDGSKYLHVVPSLDTIVNQVSEVLFDEVRALIRQEVVAQYADTLSDEQIQTLVDAFVNGDAQEKGAFGSRKVHDSIKDDEILSEVYKSVRNSIEAKMKKTPQSNANMVRDIIGGVTNNKLYVRGGHTGSDYWYQGNGTPTYSQIWEAWAEFFAAKVTNNDNCNTQNALYFPTTASLFEEYATELYDYYLDYYTNTYSPYTHDLNGLRVSDSDMVA